MTCLARRPARLAVFLTVALLALAIWGTAGATSPLVSDASGPPPSTLGAKIGATGSGDTN